MVYHVLAALIAFVFPSFYPRIRVRNARFLNVSDPAIVAINHPNAFADPVGLCYIMYPQRFWFLARGDVFKPGIVSWFFDRIGIIPIFRLRDGGKEGLQKNDATYRKVNHHLKRGEKVIVFAEGLCIMERRLRPLKKGVARMVFGAYEEIDNPNLLVIPVGVNYTQPDKPGSSLLYNVGEPIRVHDFLKARDPNNARAQKNFLEYLEPHLKALITHIDKPKNDLLVLQTEELFKLEELKKQRKKHPDLGDEFDVLQQLTEKINRADEKKPEALELYREACRVYFTELKMHGLRDWLIRDHMRKEVSTLRLLFRSVLLLLGLPYFIFSWLTNILPHQLSRYTTKRVVRNREFYASFSIAFSMVYHLIYYIILSVLLVSLSSDILASLFILFLVLMGYYFCLIYSPFYKRTKGLLRIWRNPLLLESLKKQRKTLHEAFNTL